MKGTLDRFLLAACLVWAPWAAARAAPPCDGLPVGRVELVGCADSACGRPPVHEALVRWLAAAVGESYDPARAAQAARALEATGYVVGVRPRCERDASGRALVVFEARPAGIVREVDIDGTVFLFEDDIRKRLLLRPGTPLAPATEAGRAVLSRQRDAIVRLYEREGFSGTQVEVEARELGHGEYAVRVHIDEGRRNQVQHVEVHVEGPRDEGQPGVDASWACPVPPASAIARASGAYDVRIFAPMTARDIGAKVRRYLLARGFESPRVRVEYDPAALRLRIDVQLRTCWWIRFYERDRSQPALRGFRPVAHESWYDVLTFGTSGTFDFDEADVGRKLLQLELENTGYFYANVVLDYRAFEHPADRRLANGLRVPDSVRGAITYRVTRGPALEIRRIRWRGVHAFSKDDLVNRIETRAWNFFGEGGYLQVVQMFSDLETIRQAYREAGFYAMRFRFAAPAPGPATVERTVQRRPGAVLYTYRLRDLAFRAWKPDHEHILYLEIGIDEGPRARVRHISVEGWPRAAGLAPPDSGLEVGAPISPPRALRAAARLASQLRDAGFVHAKVGFRCRADRSRRCGLEGMAGRQVDLVFTAQPGRRFRVGPVLLQGAFATRPWVLRRDLPRPGSWLSPHALRTAEQKLRALGPFRSVAVFAAGVDQEAPPAVLPVVCRVEERPAQYLDLATGFESLQRASIGEGAEMPPEASAAVAHSVALMGRTATWSGRSVPFTLPDLLLVLQAEYVHLNAFGTAREIHVPVKYGLSTTSPLRLVVAAPTLIDRRFFGTSLLFRTTVFGLLDEANDPFDRLEGGVELELSQTLLRRLVVSGQYAVRAASTRPLATPAQPSPGFSPLSLQNEPRIRVSWEGLDSPTHPTRGVRAGVTLSYLNDLDIGTRSADNFFKYLADTEVVVPLFGRVLLANFLRAGSAVAFAGNAHADLPLDRRYQLGGTRGVRGFATGGITQYDAAGNPLDADPATPGIVDPVVGGDTVVYGSHELRFPLGLRLGPLELWGAGFFDWGALADTWVDLHLKSFRTSAGVGVRFLLFGTIPIRVDYGIKLDRRCAEWQAPPDPATQPPGPCVRQEAFGALDFNILYPF